MVWERNERVRNVNEWKGWESIEEVEIKYRNIY